LFVFYPPGIPLFIVKAWRKFTGKDKEDGGRRSAEQEAEEAWKLEGQNHSHQLGENVQVHDPFS
jgi:hypothetical protein